MDNAILVATLVKPPSLVESELTALPEAVEWLKDAVVVDLVYGSRPTPLVSSALEMGRAVIDGREVLFVQVRRQFELMTGREMPADLARAILGYQAEFVGSV